MKRQGSRDRMDESLGMRRGRESSKEQSYKDRRDESMGMKSSRRGTDSEYSKGMFSVKDNEQAGVVHSVNSFAAAKKGNEKIRPYEGNANWGYPGEAWNYQW